MFNMCVYIYVFSAQPHNNGPRPNIDHILTLKYGKINMTPTNLILDQGSFKQNIKD